MTARPQRSPLSEDPDVRLLRRGWLVWAVATALLAWLGWRERSPEREAMISWALGAPAVALWLAWPLCRGTIAFWHWTRARPYANRHGAYFEFNGRQIRVFFEAAEIWIAAEDVFDVFDLTGRARDPERVRLITGRDGLALAPGSDLLAFTGRGLAAWMERRQDRVAADFVRWFDTQVVAPRRRKRELHNTASSQRDRSAPLSRE